MGSSKKNQVLSQAKRKSKNFAAEHTIPDLPSNIHNDKVEIEKQESKTEKACKKRKRSSEVTEVGTDIEATERKAAKRENEGKFDAEEKESCNGEDIVMRGGTTTEDNTGQPRKSKKERKAERRARETGKVVKQEKHTLPDENTVHIPEPEQTEVVVNMHEEVVNLEDLETKHKMKNNYNQERGRTKATEGGESKSTRFIVFIGNLPFSATTETVTKHFAAVRPISVRHRTRKEDPSKSKGFAFLEFEGYDHMKTCLKLFHHSTFHDGISPPRTLNVELTAGGGGNTKDRKTKIQDKNRKLNEERVRRIHEEQKAKYEKAADAQPKDSGVHPSRRGIVPMS